MGSCKAHVTFAAVVAAAVVFVVFAAVVSRPSDGGVCVGKLYVRVWVGAQITNNAHFAYNNTQQYNIYLRYCSVAVAAAAAVAATAAAATAIAAATAAKA